MLLRPLPLQVTPPLVRRRTATAATVRRENTRARLRSNACALLEMFRVLEALGVVLLVNRPDKIC